MAVKMEGYTSYKFHCTCGESKKLVSCSIPELQSSIESKFSVRPPFVIKLYLPEVEDYIEWDRESESMVAAEPSSKIWKIVVERPLTADRNSVPGMNAQGMNSDSFYRDMTPEEPPKNTKVFFGGLPDSVSKAEMKKLFEPFGSIEELDILKNFGFIHFKTESEAREAVKHLNNTDFKDKRIRVQMSRSNVRTKPGMGSYSCYYCGKDGHWTKECPRRLNEERETSLGGRADPYRDPYYDYYSRGAPPGPSPSPSAHPASYSADRYRPYADPYRRPPPPSDPYADPYYARSYYSSRPSDPYGPDYRPSRLPSHPGVPPRPGFPPPRYPPPRPKGSRRYDSMTSSEEVVLIP